MKQRPPSTVLFLCTGNYYRSRLAEILFNAVAGRMGLPWRATSRGLALERGTHNIGSMAPLALAALKSLGVHAPEATGRLPIAAVLADFTQAAHVVALKHAEHLPLLQERFPEWAEKVEFWEVDDVPDVLPQIEREVNALVARLLGGGERPTPRVEEAPPPKPASPKAPPTVKVGRETAGRNGRGVVTVFDTPLDADGLRELAAKLKQRCGTGGTVKDGRIEIQGDQRDRVVAELGKLGYRVKRVGG